MKFVNYIIFSNGLVLTIPLVNKIDKQNPALLRFYLLIFVSVFSLDFATLPRWFHKAYTTTFAKLPPIKLYKAPQSTFTIPQHLLYTS